MKSIYAEKLGESEEPSFIVREIVGTVDKHVAWVTVLNGQMLAFGDYVVFPGVTLEVWAVGGGHEFKGRPVGGPNQRTHMALLRLMGPSTSCVPGLATDQVWYRPK